LGAQVFRKLSFKNGSHPERKTGEGMEKPEADRKTDLRSFSWFSASRLSVGRVGGFPKAFGINSHTIKPHRNVRLFYYCSFFALQSI